MSNLTTIEEVHEENWELIKKYGLKDRMELPDGTHIWKIHCMYGWVYTTNINSPARVKDLIEYFEQRGLPIK